MLCLQTSTPFGRAAPQVISAFTKKKVVTLKKDGFNGGSKAEDDRTTSIRCSVKANEGHLYPLDKAFFFVANKPMLVEFEKVRPYQRSAPHRAAPRRLTPAPPPRSIGGSAQLSKTPRR